MNNDHAHIDRRTGILPVQFPDSAIRNPQSELEDSAIEFAAERPNRLPEGNTGNWITDAQADATDVLDSVPVGGTPLSSTGVSPVVHPVNQVNQVIFSAPKTETTNRECGTLEDGIAALTAANVPGENHGCCGPNVEPASRRFSTPVEPASRRFPTSCPVPPAQPMAGASNAEAEPSFIPGAAAPAAPALSSRTGVPPVSSASPEALEIAAERRRILSSALPLLSSGRSQKDVCLILDISTANLSRLLSLADSFSHFSASGFSAKCSFLLSQPLESLAPKSSCGLKSEFEQLLAVPEIAEELKSLYLATIRASSESMTHGRATGSMATAMKHLGEHELCRQQFPELAALLRNGRKPAPLLRYMGSSCVKGNGALTGLRQTFQTAA
ncbi:MAG: hypothetical protein WCO56_26815 [Verrucomicrobiota bacterium]